MHQRVVARARARTSPGHGPHAGTDLALDGCAVLPDLIKYP
ncbi:hypothetical protein BN2537_1297 [Streptomyces venezuelae]|nr:hypothetical protein BN2537_1297 [Streptomyces venezuelae]